MVCFQTFNDPFEVRSRVIRTFSKQLNSWEFITQIKMVRESVNLALNSRVTFKLKKLVHVHIKRSYRFSSRFTNKEKIKLRFTRKNSRNHALRKKNRGPSKKITHQLTLHGA